MMNKSIYDSKVEEIIKGRELWLDLKHRKDIDEKDFVVIYPNNDLIDYAEKYIDYYVAKRNARRIFAITTDSSLVNRSLYSFIKEISDDEMEGIVSYYSLMPFHNNMAFVSFSKPYGRIDMKSMERNNISEDDIMKYGIFGFSEEEIPYE